MSKDEEISLIEKKLWTSKDVWKVVTGIGFIVFTLTTIYNRFVLLEQITKENKAEHEVAIKHIRETYDTKVKVLEDRIDNQYNRLNKKIENLEEVSHYPGPNNYRKHGG